MCIVISIERQTHSSESQLCEPKCQVEEYPFLNFQTCAKLRAQSMKSTGSCYLLLVRSIFFALFQGVHQLPQEKQGFILGKNLYLLAACVQRVFVLSRDCTD